MVSSELVVLLIVCVGINTRSAQQSELTTVMNTSRMFYSAQVHDLGYSNNYSLLLHLRWRVRFISMQYIHDLWLPQLCS